MAHDGSLCSEMEAWIVTTLAAIVEDEVAFFEANEIILYPGLASWDGSLGEVMEEFTRAARKPFATVGYKSSRALPQATEDSSDRESLFMVHLITENQRPALARVGETGTPTIPGSNKLMELVVDALHDKVPDKSSATLSRTSQQTRVENVRSIPCPKGISVIEIELIVREVPSA